MKYRIITIIILLLVLAGTYVYTEGVSGNTSSTSSDSGIRIP